MQAFHAATTNAATDARTDSLADANAEASCDVSVSAAASGPLDEYGLLQRRLLLATLLVTIVAAMVCWLLFGAQSACSLFLGGTCGLLYLRLLARSVGRIGPGSRSLGRAQILVPALLVVAAARVPAIEMLPALAGFVLYKPALLLQAVIAP